MLSKKKNKTKNVNSFLDLDSSSPQHTVFFSCLGNRIIFLIIICKRIVTWNGDVCFRVCACVCVQKPWRAKRDNKGHHGRMKFGKVRKEEENGTPCLGFVVRISRRYAGQERTPPWRGYHVSSFTCPLPSLRTTKEIEETYWNDYSSFYQILNRSRTFCLFFFFFFFSYCFLSLPVLDLVMNCS